MPHLRTKGRGLAFRVGLYAVALAAGLQVQAASAQDKPAATPASVQPQTASRGVYYVDFRARTAASYGHAFVWYGRADQKQVEIAGLHPATGGSGLELCSGDMLLEALVACAGVTLKAVSTALEIPLSSLRRLTQSSGYNKWFPGTRKPM